MEPAGTKQPAAIKVLIVEDHQVVADGLSMLLGDDPSLDVVGVASTGATAVEMAQQYVPDVVIMDFGLPDQTGAETSTQIRQILPDTAVLFLTADDSDSAVLAAVRSGARGYLSKTEAGTMLLDAVHRAAAGEMLLPASLLARLIVEEPAIEPGLADSELTPRQLDVLRLMADGLGTKAIAERLQLKPSTTAWHVQTILEKLDAHSRLEAVAQATRRGLLTR